MKAEWNDLPADPNVARVQQMEGNSNYMIWRLSGVLM
jgi:hypothetical protein